MNILQSRLTAMLIIVISATPLTTKAQTDDAQKRAWDLIADTADRICSVVATRGEATSSELQGNVQAQLSGLAARLTQAGVSAAGRVTSEQYQGVLREQLAATLQDNAKCKLEVFRTLQVTLVTRPIVPPRVFTVTRESGWRGGGYDQVRWCQDVIGTLRGEHPTGVFNIINQSERSESKCAPFNCPQYLYTCTVEVRVPGGG